MTVAVTHDKQTLRANTILLATVIMTMTTMMMMMMMMMIMMIVKVILIMVLIPIISCHRIYTQSTERSTL